MGKEIWKDVVGYEGFYSVSNLGKVRRNELIITSKNGVKKRVNENIMIPLDNGKGYLRIKLSKENKSRRVMLHRIIAEAFILNEFNSPFVNHIDGDKKNNQLKNLEWCTQSENVRHAWSIGLCESVRESSRATGKITIHNIKMHNCKKIKHVLTGIEFASIVDCAKHFKICRKTVRLGIKKGIYTL